MMIDSSRKEIFQYIYMDFQEYSHERTDAMGKMLQDACIVLDVMGGSFKQDLLDWLIKSLVFYCYFYFIYYFSLIDIIQLLPLLKILSLMIPNLIRELHFGVNVRKLIVKSGLLFSHLHGKFLPSFSKHSVFIVLFHCDMLIIIAKSHFTKMLSTKIPDVKILSSVLSKTILFEDSQTT